MKQSFDGNKHYEIMQAILIHILKYHFDVKKTVVFLSHIINGEFEYVTREKNARAILEKYGLEEIRKTIFENLIISEGLLLHNIEKSNRQSDEKGLLKEERLLRYAYNIQNSEFQRTHNLNSDLVEDALENGLLLQFDNVGKNENPLYDWYLEKFAYNVINSKVELLLTGQVKLGWYHPSQIFSIPGITKLLNSLNNAYYKRMQSKDNKETKEQEVTVNSTELPSNNIDKREQMQNVARAISKVTEQKADYEAAKKEYEKSSASHRLSNTNIEKTSKEIDDDLDEFEAEERRILNSKHYSKEQKKEMIERLYSEFDNYTEENPEISGRHI